MKRVKAKICLAIICVLLLGFSVSATAATADLRAVVIKPETVIRQTPNLKGKVLLRTRKGAEFSILSFGKNGWIRVAISKGGYGWIRKQDVSTKAVDPPRHNPNLKELLLGKTASPAFIKFVKAETKVFAGLYESALS